MVDLAEISPRVYDDIKALSSEGDDLASTGAYEAAIEKYNAAWKLIPEPKNDWEASTWVLAAIADAAFLGGYFTSARKALDFVFSCPNAIGNPFLHLRRGQVLFELGAMEDSLDELMRAYMGAGEQIFSAEDPKYLDFLASRVRLR